MLCPKDRGGCGATLSYDEGAFCSRCMEIGKLRDMLRWVIQAVHQAHHEGDFACCKKNTCAATRATLKPLAPSDIPLSSMELFKPFCEKVLEKHEALNLDESSFLLGMLFGSLHHAEELEDRARQLETKLRKYMS